MNYRSNLSQFSSNHSTSSLSSQIHSVVNSELPADCETNPEELSGNDDQRNDVTVISGVRNSSYSVVRGM
jgi:hypothetical protein